MTEVCSISGCDAEGSEMVNLPAYPIEWEHWVCERHVAVLQNPHTRLEYLDDDTVAVVDPSD